MQLALVHILWGLPFLSVQQKIYIKLNNNNNNNSNINSLLHQPH